MIQEPVKFALGAFFLQRRVKLFFPDSNIKFNNGGERSNAPLNAADAFDNKPDPKTCPAIMNASSCQQVIFGK